MSQTRFVDTHPQQTAFIANRLDRLASLMVEQSDQMFAQAGLSFPSRAVSAILLIAERRQISTADIASALGQPHQLVTQRVELLIAEGLVERARDPADARRKILQLTPEGERQFGLLQGLLRAAAQAYEKLFEEIACDLSVAADRALAALEATNLGQRVAAAEGSHS